MTIISTLLAYMLLVLKRLFRCPPHSHFSNLLTILLCLIFVYLCLYSFDPESSIPGNCSLSRRSNVSLSNICHGGNLFGLFVLFVCANVGGKLLLLMKLPPLIGMLISGFILRNFPYINFALDIDNVWSGHIRKIALSVILIRAGFGLDPKMLRRLSSVVGRLAFIPCLVEALIGGVTSHFLLHLPWGWAFILGFVLSAVSSAIVVPSMLDLERRGLGTEKGVNTLVVAASSIDDVLSITGFSIALSFTFKSGGNVWLNMVRGPLEALSGVSYGIVVGRILWFIPSVDNDKFMFYRTLMLFVSAMAAMFGSTAFNIPGAGPLAVLTLAFVASIRWKSHPTWSNMSDNQLVITTEILWWILQPFLFGLIGSGLTISSIHTDNFGFGILVLVIGLMCRLLASFVVLFGSALNIKEKLFVSIAWLPKATIQAAIGPLALDYAIKEHSPGDAKKHGELILAIAVISIILTAPLGAFLISLTGPILLTKARNVDVTEQPNIDLKIAVEESHRLFSDEENTGF